LLARVLGELAAGFALDDPLEGLDQLLEVLGVEVDVVLDALVFLGLLDGLLEEVSIDSHDGLAEHLDEAAVGVPRESL
jgi:hypothetical protein